MDAPRREAGSRSGAAILFRLPVPLPLDMIPLPMPRTSPDGGLYDEDPKPLVEVHR